MAKNLVVVESPAKAGTIKKYLGSDFEVLASYGHVRDLLPKEGAVDPDLDFAMKYEQIEKNTKHVDAIFKALKGAKALYLATDLDREGEAISWHLVELLRDRAALDNVEVYRVIFSEITERAIKDAISDPRSVSMELVNAQQTRRALDYLVGFHLSPLLWKKIKRGLSAGRVQSPALRMICEREAEIEKFKPQEYWTIDAMAAAEDAPFSARLNSFDGERLKQFDIANEQRAEEVRDALLDAAAGSLKVLKVEKKQRKRNPAPPFITSTLQQEAVRKLGFTAQRAMRTAQQLYEGVDIGSGTEGLITYMRTDSVNLSQDAIAELRGFISQRYGADQVPAEPRTFRTNAKNAQEAHEAIRPTSSARTPANIKDYLTPDQNKLYDLIWKRTVACQMIHATIDTVSADLGAGERGIFRATGSTVTDPGFMTVYLEGEDDKPGAAATGDEKTLPPLVQGQTVKLNAVNADQHFTEPPPRYTEASLVKTLEEFGIGRPSTYASIISTLVAREYVTLEKKRFQPTDIGRIVNSFLTNHFSDYVDYEFTARLEDDLDAVSRGESDWLPLLRKFWEPFNAQVQDKEANVSREEANQARPLGTDPKSGKPVAVRMGRYGPYVIIGSVEDEEKPKFYGLRPGQRMDAITLEDALELTKLPREIGQTPDGFDVTVNIGRYGPYVKYDNKFVSLGADDDPYTINLERAVELIAEKKEADAKRLIQDFPEQGIKVLNGRYGPYITNGEKNAKVPKDREPASLSLEECIKLIEEAPVRRGRGAKKKTAKAQADAPAKKKKTTKKKAKKKATRKKASKKKATKKKTTKKAVSKAAAGASLDANSPGEQPTLSNALGASQD
ncbi:MAG: DNA topoisomerase I [Pseudomonadota bacterium]